MPAIVSRVINRCWYYFKLGLVVALVAAAATGVYLYVRMDDEIRGHVEAVLAEQYPQFSVSVGGARRVKDKGIAIYDLSLDEPGGGQDKPLLAIDELMLVCDVELTSLVQGVPQVERVEVRRPRLSLRRDAAGRWNFESLLPLKPCGTAIPQVVIRDGEATVSDALRADGQPLVVRDVDVVVTPMIGAPAMRSIAVRGSSVDAWPSVRIEGALGGPHVKRVEFQATVDGVQRQCRASVAIGQFLVNDTLLTWIRPLLPESFRGSTLTGVVDGTATFAWQHGAALPAAEASLSVSQGRLDDPRLPWPATELAGRLVVDGGQLKIEELAGKCGAATVAVSLNRSGWAANAPLALSARVHNAPLVPELYRALPPVLRAQWDKFLPAGTVDATIQATFDGQAWRPAATEPGEPAAQLVGSHLSFECDKFAYRLHNGSGTIGYFPAAGGQAARIDMDMVGYGGRQPIHIVGQVFDPRPGAAGWAEITGQNLEIEPAMIAAMQPNARKVVTELRPAGRFDVVWRIDRTRTDEAPVTKLTLDLIDVRINYLEFPYPLEGIRGRVAADGNNWTFKNLASGGRRPVYGEGYLQPMEEGTELFLRFSAPQAPLDDALFDALREPVQQAWKQLNPRGEVDLTAEVRHRTGQGQPNISVEIRPRESTQLRPEFFKYRFEKLTGLATYRDGHVVLADVKAQHDNTSMGASGEGFFSPDGGWTFKLVGLWADRLSASPDLLTALPEQLGKLLEKLRPTGVFSLHHGVMVFQRAPSSIAAVETDWDVQLDCHQTDLHCGIDLQNIHGSVQLVGRTDGQRSYSAGELSLETVTFQDVQFTDVRGPLWVDETQCRLGKWATEQQGQPERRLSAKAYGGTLAANAWVKFDALPQYGAEASLVGADLHRMIVERFGGQQPFQGKVDANVILSGEGPSTPRLRGEGNVHVRDANIYELPLLASLLKMLRTGDPSTTAFNQSDVKFRIQGRHITLDQIDFLGDVVNLYGKGETNFDQRINLVFYGDVVGRHAYQLPVVKNLVGQASQQFMQMYVDGTLSQPNVRTEAFPGFNQMLQQIRSDLENPVGGGAERQAQRLRTGPPGR